MGNSKTRIWRGGLSEIVGQRERDALPPAEGAAPVAASVDDARPRSAAVPQPLSATSLGAQGHNGGKTLIGHVLDLAALREQLQAQQAEQGRGHGALSTTRLVPIEELLAAAPAATSERGSESDADRTAKPAADEPEATPSPAWVRKFRLTGSQIRRGLIAVCGLSAILLRFAGGHGSAAAPQEPASEQLPVAAPSSAPAAPVEHDGVEHAAPPSGGADLAGQPAFEPRQAVDALASGDLARAQRIYAELARTTEGRSAYAEAARILALRIREQNSL